MDKINQCLADTQLIASSNLEENLKVKLILGNLRNMAKKIYKKSSKSKSIKLTEDEIDKLMKVSGRQREQDKCEETECCMDEKSCKFCEYCPITNKLDDVKLCGCGGRESCRKCDYENYMNMS